MSEIVKLDKDVYLKILDLIQAVNIHRRERLVSAKETAWKLAKELAKHDYELVDE